MNQVHSKSKQLIK